jgi:hypothetical protein
MLWKIWKLSEIICLQLKAAHIPGRINVATDRLSRLEMSGDYHLKEEVFQMIQWRCFPKVDLFASKLNRLVKTYAPVIPRKYPDNIGNALRLDTSASSCSPNFESITEISRRRKNSYFNSVILERQILIIFIVSLGKSEKVLTKGKAMKKRDLQLPPG